VTEVSVADCIVVGAGPAGLFAAREMSRAGLSVLVLDRGGSIEERTAPNREDTDPARRIDYMTGFGGAGLFSDGTLNLSPYVGGNLDDLTGDSGDSWDLVARVETVLEGYGAPKGRAENGRDQEEAIGVRAAAAGASFVPIRQKHLGTDGAVAVLRAFSRDLADSGVVFRFHEPVKEFLVDGGRCTGVILESGESLRAPAVLAAVGRIGSRWLEDIGESSGIAFRHGPLDVGCRLEVPAPVLENVTAVCRDPKFHIYTRTYDDFVRTFCTNVRGFVVKESYGDYVQVNGHSYRNRESANTNFAFLVRTSLTRPVSNSSLYGRSIALLATTLGGGKPLVQRLGDLRRGRRSTPGRLARNLVSPTLKEATPGDVSMAMPHRVIQNLLEGLETLDRIIPGVASDSTLLYAPEIKYYAVHLRVDGHLETSLPDLFAAGDGAGLSRDIINAAATGLLAARGILRKHRVR